MFVFFVPSGDLFQPVMGVAGGCVAGLVHGAWDLCGCLRVRMGIDEAEGVCVALEVYSPEEGDGGVWRDLEDCWRVGLVEEFFSREVVGFNGLEWDVDQPGVVVQGCNPGLG